MGEKSLQKIEICPKCNIKLQSYYIKPDGEYIVNYKRCINCLEIYEEYSRNE